LSKHRGNSGVVGTAIPDIENGFAHSRLLFLFSLDQFDFQFADEVGLQILSHQRTG
jgi:hypothetical protein